MNKVVATNRIFPETRDLLSRQAQVISSPSETPLDRQQTLAAARDADGLMVFMPDLIDAEFLAACPQLRVIGAALKGYDNIDIEAATQAGIWVTIVPDLLTAPTAELAIGLMLALGRQLVTADQTMRTEHFEGWRPRFYGAGLAGTVVGLIGFGAVGQAIAARLQGFDCKVLAYDPALSSASASSSLVSSSIAHSAPLDNLLQQSDWLVLALPLTPATYHLIDAQALAQMKPGSRLINPARGSLVDEEAVADALESGHLAGYAADVFACEDWARADRPLTIPPRLIALGSQTVLTPHLGSAVVEARRAIEQAAAESILAVLANQDPPRAVNRPMVRRR
ncbi:MAG: phosphonate dehydrogenase [Cyanophyceae cyanobacterium]|jgi:phosphonate dehydrogenase